MNSFDSSQDRPVLGAVRWISACLSVADLDASVQWYCERLGFAPVLRQDFPELQARLAYIRHGDLILELVESTPSVEIIRPTPPGHTVVRGVTQVTFYVADAEEALERAKAAGLRIVMDLVRVPQIGVTAFFSEDLDGNLIEFHQADWAAAPGGDAAADTAQAAS